MCRKITIVILVLIAPVLIGLIIRSFWHTEPRNRAADLAPPVGAIVDTEHGISIHSNGKDCSINHGKHYAANGYYYGRRWQCVEFVKRYYHDHLQHGMPDGWGHAKSFFDPAVKHGSLNMRRGLLQFHNGGDEAPKPNDLLVYTHGEYGHVAIISKVRKNHVEIVQQNVLGQPRQLLPLTNNDNNWVIGRDNRPAGWLRLITKSISQH